MRSGARWHAQVGAGSGAEATNPIGTSRSANGDPLKDGGEIADDCPGVFITLEDGPTVVMSQVTDDVSGVCQRWAPEQNMGMAA